MRGGAALLGLAALLLLPLLAGAKASEWQTYLADNFTDTTIFPTGQFGEAYYTVDNGEYVIDGQQATQDSLSALTDSLYYYYVEAQCSVSKSTAGELAFTGLVFHYKTTLQKLRSYYVFYVYPDGYYGAKRVIGDEVTIVLPLARSTEIDTHGPNTLAVDAQGTRFDLYINGKYVNGFTDVRIDGGGFGFYVSKQTAGSFDNFKVKIERKGGQDVPEMPQAKDGKGAAGEGKYPAFDIPKDPNRPVYPWEIKSQRQKERAEDEDASKDKGKGGKDKGDDKNKGDDKGGEPQEDPGHHAPPPDEPEPEPAPGNSPAVPPDEQVVIPPAPEPAPEPAPAPAPEPAPDPEPGSSSAAADDRASRNQPDTRVIEEHALGVDPLPAPPSRYVGEGLGLQEPGRDQVPADLPSADSGNSIEITPGAPPPSPSASAEEEPAAPAPSRRTAGAAAKPAPDEPEPDRELLASAMRSNSWDERDSSLPVLHNSGDAGKPGQAERDEEAADDRQAEADRRAAEQKQEEDDRRADAARRAAEKQRKEDKRRAEQEQRDREERERQQREDAEQQRKHGEEDEEPAGSPPPAEPGHPPDHGLTPRSEILAEDGEPSQPRPRNYSLTAPPVAAGEPPADDQAGSGLTPFTTSETPGEVPPDAAPDPARAGERSGDTILLGPAVTAPADSQHWQSAEPPAEDFGEVSPVVTDEPVGSVELPPQVKNPDLGALHPPAPPKGAAPAANPFAGKPGAVHLTDDFSKPRWPESDSGGAVLRYFGAAYEVNNVQASGVTMPFQAEHLGEVALSAGVDFLDGFSQAGYGLAVRFIDGPKGPSYYGLVVTQAGSCMLMRVTSGKEKIIASWKTSAAFKATQRNTLRLEAIGGMVRGYVNGQLAVQAKDNTLPPGGYALFAAPGVSVRYDDLSVDGLHQ
jgi:hypothetical protein